MIDEFTTVLGDGSDARLLTIVSATLDGGWIGQTKDAIANRQIGDPQYSATTARWLVCTLDNDWLKTVQLVVTSKDGKLYARVVKRSHSRNKSLNDCGTWPLDNISNEVVDSSTARGYGVASLRYTIGLSPAGGTSRRALEDSSTEQPPSAKAIIEAFLMQHPPDVTRKEMQKTLSEDQDFRQPASA